ncbi:Predicted nucleic acid-binding protein, contains PIN domain [Quadrisphaera granulorum]|uniref:Ribonuclease VapC n=1 Tax=Quadrisphaera granulorum TaxID=317664 RepID=A0A316A378_9ACTN|nr:type II toxin-antitoxin system VapC family toxin [Quadrisphaera granulorum]PWJ51164.1 putative nucleic acid-binding protein [Quadrisphaera granulorum]SZE97814.1 Predicted nucleic acid-binding protein, contains PIN domain [Quadrisphaera granulorum]
MIVLDVSVLTSALTDDGPLGVAARAELSRDLRWAAPAHLVVEVFSAVRGRRAGGHITEERALDAIAALAAAVIEPVATSPLLRRMWELRGHVTGNDAAYAVAAESLGCPLVTADLRLARAAGLRCEVRVVRPE